MRQVELEERKSFLSHAKEVLLGARDTLDGQATREKVSRDERAVRTIIAILDAWTVVTPSVK